jgi:hypothetical protein
MTSATGAMSSCDAFDTKRSGRSRGADAGREGGRAGEGGLNLPLLPWPSGSICAAQRWPRSVQLLNGQLEGDPKFVRSRVLVLHAQRPDASVPTVAGR